jgi:hypothetical protein
MKKKLVALLTATTLTTTGALAGCGTAWWQNLVNNPVATVTTFEQSVQNVLNIAEATWSTLSVLLPANVQAQAQAAYNKAVIASNAALTVLNDALQAAAAVQGPAPNFAALMQDVSSAIAQVTTVISQFQAQAPASASATGLTELNNAVNVMHRIGGVK